MVSNLVFFTFLWLGQLAVMAIFDNRKDVLNKLLNWSALLTAVFITFIGLSWVWLIVPLLVIPILAGLAGGTVSGLLLRRKSNDQTSKNEKEK